MAGYHSLCTGPPLLTSRWDGVRPGKWRWPVVSTGIGPPTPRDNSPVGPSPGWLRLTFVNRDGRFRIVGEQRIRLRLDSLMPYV